MPLEQKRLKFTLDEAFGIQPVSQEEVELNRTNDYETILDPNWQSQMTQFSMGMQNSRETILGNIMSSRNEDFKLSEFLSFMSSSQAALFDFILSVLRLLIRKPKSSKEEK